MSARTRTSEIQEFQRRLSALSAHPIYPDDFGISIALAEALKAVKAGNFGVGACLTNRKNQILARGRNSVFSPRFRSDQHAEMAVLDRAEKTSKRIGRPKDLTLYTSLECCPMCLSRVILAGIGNTRYAAEDDIGGMTEHRSLLPPVWRKLAQPQSFAAANCSAEHRLLAADLFKFRLNELNEKLVLRAGYRSR